MDDSTAAAQPPPHPTPSPLAAAETMSNHHQQPAAAAPALEPSFCKWVDYLPGQLETHNNNNAKKQQQHLVRRQKRLSMDPSETGVTEKSTDDDDMETDDTDWPESNSLEGYNMVPPALLLGEGDVMMQHELLLDDQNMSSSASHHQHPHHEDPSVSPELFAHSLEELMEQRRTQLMRTMQASQRTRQCLEPHIKQRAGLANVLSQIERSSWTVQEHLCYHNGPASSEEAAATSAAAAAGDASSHAPSDTNSVDMVEATLKEVDPEVEKFAATVLVDDVDVDQMLS